MTSLETLELEAVDNALAGRSVDPEHTELADLALRLRDDRPEPSLTWATHMDRRVAAGFPRKPRKQWIWVRRALPAVAVAAVLVPIISIAALTSGTEDLSSESGGGSSSSVAAPEAASDDSAGSSAGSSAATEESTAGDEAFRADRQSAPPAISPPSGGGDAASDGRSNRKQERSATLVISVPRRELDAAGSRASSVTSQLGGFVASSNISMNGGGTLELRVPTDRLDQAIQRLSDLGRVRELQRQTLDITSDFVSARTRLSEDRAERRGLMRQLEDADTLEETDELKGRLRIVNRQITAARRSLTRVSNRADYANISLSLVPASGSNEEVGGWSPGDAFNDAVRVLEVIAGVALIAAAVLLPLGFLWLLAWLAHRGLTRRRRDRALDIA